VTSPQDGVCHQYKENYWDFLFTAQEENFLLLLVELKRDELCKLVLSPLEFRVQLFLLSKHPKTEPNNQVRNAVPTGISRSYAGIQVRIASVSKPSDLCLGRLQHQTLNYLAVALIHNFST
jgi:hypothetical protein